MPVFSPIQKNLRVQCTCMFQFLIPKRYSSSKRWQARQLKDRFTREAAVQGLKSRAAFKLLQIDEKFHIFRSGQTVVDLGYAPGSWSQVAVARTQPHGRVLGVDIIPAQPPKGVSTIQGNFLAPDVQAYVQEFLRNPSRGRPHPPSLLSGIDYNDRVVESSVDLKSPDDSLSETTESTSQGVPGPERTVDVVLSDMSAPWYQTTGFWKRSLSNPYNRMMNTSGMSFRDHAGSMDLCRAALQFSFEVLKAGGHFVCKFYQGAEDKDLEKQLRGLFRKVHRLKPESSRNVCFGYIDKSPHKSSHHPFTDRVGRNQKRHTSLALSVNSMHQKMRYLRFHEGNGQFYDLQTYLLGALILIVHDEPLWYRISK